MAKPKAEQREETELLVKLTELWHERGLSLPTRTVYLGSETVDENGESGVDARLAERVVKNIHVLEQISSAPITLLVNNLGGDEYNGLAIVDAIQASPCRVTGLVRGCAMSMGSWILQTCERRIMGRNATQMIHCGSMSFSGHLHTAQRWADEAKRTTNLMEDQYLVRIRERHPNYSLEELRKLLDHDTFLTAQQSVDLGLADEIG